VLVRNLVVVLLPAIVFFGAMGLTYKVVTTPETSVDYSMLEMGGGFSNFDSDSDWNSGGLAEPEGTESLGLAEPEGASTLGFDSAPAEAAAPQADAQEEAAAVEDASVPAPMWFWIILAIGTGILVLFYALFTLARLEVFKMLLSSFFPLAILILAVLGSIVFGFATPSEAAAMGAFGGILLAFAYGQLNFGMVRESVYLAAKTSAMVCWLFVGSAIFSAAFALLGGQEIINAWVLGMDLTPTQFLILSQVVIFLLGWPLEWTEIIVIFMPIFLPLVNHFGIDPLFFGLLVALNLQTAFLSPPVAMSAFYLKGVSPPHVTLNQIFLGMMPFMGIQILAIFLMYMFPGIGLWLPEVLY
ncbi:MAG TPA: TRAP transporter large permease subunit, partial [Burkholderiaceae bacterium]|nr:TRAP transporter large permease subunit [Burkholderiaceae bacterium]